MASFNEFEGIPAKDQIVDSVRDIDGYSEVRDIVRNPSEIHNAVDQIVDHDEYHDGNSQENQEMK